MEGEGDDQHQIDFQTIEEIDQNENLVSVERFEDDEHSHDTQIEGRYENIDSTLIPYVGMEFLSMMRLHMIFIEISQITSDLRHAKFVDQYDNAVADRRSKELDEDFVCMTTKPDLTKVTPMESHAAQVYTRNVFVKFKEEFQYVFHCHQKKLKKDVEKSIYEVTYSSDDKDLSQVVNVIPDYNFKCSCAKFENAGLLCKHILYLIKQKYNFKCIPRRYILARWTLNARYTTGDKVDVTLEESQNKSNENKVIALEAWNFRTYMDRLFDKVVHNKFDQHSQAEHY
ncbi:hypothetical protein POM88_018939 [Heracleum sosnowskyi]|uniref:Protein FAR1-RELATED SEQUENCE n=1 Tax=Heracleum sosnowskyi TaxID=360622 RepID=A0AAD8ITW5_9APIA|nr:hypothetical protein POM88_018939 [Heracleum sosnowskyi]